MLQSAGSVANIDQLSPEERTSPPTGHKYSTLPTRGKKAARKGKAGGLPVRAEFNIATFRILNILTEFLSPHFFRTVSFLSILRCVHFLFFSYFFLFFQNLPIYSYFSKIFLFIPIFAPKFLFFPIFSIILNKT